MRDIIIKGVKERSFLKFRKVSKIGVEGAPLHDILVSQSDNKLACFRDDKDGKHYLYSLVNGGLITTSMQEIECVSDNYFTYMPDLIKLYCVNHDNNTYTIVNDNSCEYDYYNNILVEYNTLNKQVTITDMESREKWKFVFSELPDSNFSSIKINYEEFTEDKFVISIAFEEEGGYFNCFDINTKTFLYNQFFNGGVYDIHEHEGELYVITGESELINGKGDVLIKINDVSIDFDEVLPYVYLEKLGWSGLARLQDGNVLVSGDYDEINIYETYAILKKDEKYGLASLNDGKIIFEVEYDDIIDEDNSFKAVKKTYTTYIKEKNKIVD